MSYTLSRILQELKHLMSKNDESYIALIWQNQREDKFGLESGGGSLVWV